jgi:hypothetical protein
MAHCDAAGANGNNRILTTAFPPAAPDDAEWMQFAPWFDGDRLRLPRPRRCAHRAGWPWRLPARAPTDPDVRTLAHPVPRPTGSPSAMVPEAIRSSYGDMLLEPRCVRHVSLDQVRRPTLRFPPQGPPGRVPLLQRYYQSATTSCRPSRRTSLPSFGGTSVSLVGFAPRRTSAPPGPGVGNPVAPTGVVAEETTGSRKFLGNPHCLFAHVQSTPAGLLTPDHCGSAAWPLVCEKQGLPRKVFRRSIAWHSD